MAASPHKETDACSSTGSTEEADTSPAEVLSRSDSGDLDSPEASPVAGAKHQDLDRDLWHIHGNSYDLTGFVDKHPGGRLAILSGKGRDCTALFESYHPWNDKHRKVLLAYGPAPPPPDPFFEEIKAGVRKAFPGGGKETKMRYRTLLGLSSLWLLMVVLFFGVRTPLACCLAGVLMGTIGTRLSHEGAHYQIPGGEAVNRLSLFLGYFLTGPSMAWHYRHVISHHAHTNQPGDVDVEHIWVADLMPKWLKVLALPVMPVMTVIELGPKSLVDLLLLRHVGGHHVDLSLGGLLIEVPIWLAVHGLFGPSLLCYVCMWWCAGAIFLPCSQVAHAILFPNPRQHASWAEMQIAESCDFAADSDFWYHVAFGLTTQAEHHLFPGVGHHCYERIRHIVKDVCKKHGVTHMDVSAGKAFGALWTRWITGAPAPLA